jgi:hypothetical protein
MLARRKTIVIPYGISQHILRYRLFLEFLRVFSFSSGTEWCIHFIVLSSFKPNLLTAVYKSLNPYRLFHVVQIGLVLCLPLVESIGDALIIYCETDGDSCHFAYF